MLFKTLFMYAALALAGLNSFSPSICMWEPVLPISAGSTIAARIDGLASVRCEALLRFMNSTFLPINWTFEPSTCVNLESIQLVIPTDVPNGDAYLVWDCSGENNSSCLHINLEGGSNNLEDTPPYYVGMVNCVPDSPPTTRVTQNSASVTSDYFSENTFPYASNDGGSTSAVLTDVTKSIDVAFSKSVQTVTDNLTMRLKTATHWTNTINKTSINPALTRTTSTVSTAFGTPESHSSGKGSTTQTTVTITTTLTACAPPNRA